MMSFYLSIILIMMCGMNTFVGITHSLSRASPIPLERCLFYVRGRYVSVRIAFPIPIVEMM